MLTSKGYEISKDKISNILHLRNILNVRPKIPSVFVNPKYVKKYPVYTENEKYMYVPKYYGITTFGPLQGSKREPTQTDSKHWLFAGSLRTSQMEVVSSFLKPEPHDGVISLHTGGGKTVCALYIASVLKVPTVILVHNTFLKDQWVERIKNFLPNARIGSLQGSVVDVENKDIVVAMLQSISMKNYENSVFEKIGFVVVDECHHIASEVFSKAMPKLNSKYMLGLSATPERKDGLMHVINWFLGPILYTSNTTDKIDTQVMVEVYDFNEGDSEYNEVIYNKSGVMFTSLMINKITKYHPRNVFISNILVDLMDEPERQILVLTDRVEHTTALFDLLPEDIQRKACVLSRNTDQTQRNEWYDIKKIIISTYSMCKEGFDVPSLNTLVIATPRPDVDQIVGRILRTEKHERSIDPLIIDITDPAFARQFRERKRLYDKRKYVVKEMILS